MNTYGRKIVRNEYEIIKHRMILSWIVCLVLGLVLGLIIGVWCELHEEQPKYGTIDGKVHTEEISFDWDSGAELGFVPLDVPMDEEMQEFIYCLSYGYNLDFAFVMAVIKNESGFKSDTISSTNDYGLMQINKINHEWLSEKLGITDFNDPHQNVRAGTFILRRLFEKYEDPSKVLMAYNLGSTGALKLWNKGVHETSYSQKILKTYAEYKSELEGELND